MVTVPRSAAIANPVGLPAKHAYVMAGVCLVLGLLAGYFLLGGTPNRSVMRTQSTAAPVAGALGQPSGTHPQLTMEQMKQMADVQASTLIEKSKADPKNVALLVEIAGIYQAAHQFTEAAGYFEGALRLDPKNVSARTEFASCLYYSGDADGALHQLTQALTYRPADPHSLFNLGMIKYRAKNDPKGAIVAWQELLKAHPDLDRKPVVEKLIAEAQASLAEEK